MCVCAEVEELRGQVNRLQSRNRELELQSSGRNSDHARQIRQVKTRITQRFTQILQKSSNIESRNVIRCLKMLKAMFQQNSWTFDRVFYTRSPESSYYAK